MKLANYNHYSTTHIKTPVLLSRLLVVALVWQSKVLDLLDPSNVRVRHTEKAKPYTDKPM